jgi:hypothetical protein
VLRRGLGAVEREADDRVAREVEAAHDPGGEVRAAVGLVELDLAGEAEVLERLPGAGEGLEVAEADLLGEVDERAGDDGVEAAARDDAGGAVSRGIADGGLAEPVHVVAARTPVREHLRDEVGTREAVVVDLIALTGGVKRDLSHRRDSYGHRAYLLSRMLSSLQHVGQASRLSVRV